MLQCRFCQAALLEGQKFCDQCGKSTEPPMMCCGECGQPSVATAKFCGKCGATLAPAVAPLPEQRIEPSLRPVPTTGVDKPSKTNASTSEVPHLFLGRWTEQQLKKGLKVAGVVAVVGIVGMLLMIQLSGGEQAASEGEVVASVNLSAANGAVVQAGALAPGADQPASNPNRKIIYQLGNIPSKPKEADESDTSLDSSTPADSAATNSGALSVTTGASSTKDSTHSATDAKPADAQTKPAKVAPSHDAEVDAAKKAMNDFLKQQQSQ